MLLLPYTPRRPGRMSLALRSALQADASQAFVAVDLGLPEATSVLCHVSDRAVALADCYYAPRVLRAGVGPSGAVVSERTSGLGAREFEVELEDADGLFSSLVARYSNRLRRSTVLARIGAPGVPREAWCPHFTGIVDAWDRSGPASWTVQCRTDDLALAAKFPKAAFLASDWPMCAPDLLGTWAPIVLGVHKSNGVQSAAGTGMVPTAHVDTALYRHVVSLGKLKAVVPVYGDGVTISASDYSVVYVTTASGRVWTVVQFNTSAHEAKNITVDCQGLTDKGDGSGVALTNPVHQLRLLLANFILADWRAGDWLTPTLIDEPAFWAAAQYAARKGLEGSIYYGGDQATGQEALEKWAGSWELKLLWTGTGKLAVVALDHGVEEYTGDAVPWVRGRGDLAVFRLSTATRQLVSEVSVEYLPSAADGRTFETLKVRDLDMADEAPITKRLENSAARRN